MSTVFKAFIILCVFVVTIGLFMWISPEYAQKAVYQIKPEPDGLAIRAWFVLGAAFAGLTGYKFIK